MNDIPFSALPVPVAAPARFPWYHWRRWGLNFLTISILAHVLFGTGATYLIVQTIQAKRKQTFAGAPASANAPAHAIEHKVQLQKKQQTMSAPAPVKRITTTSNAKVALPAMPAMPRMDSAIVPVAMAGMGSAGVSMGLGTGGGSGTGGGGGGGLSLFGFRNKTSGTFAGTFFDLKQTPDGKPTFIAQDDKTRKDWPSASASAAYQTAVTGYVANGMDDVTMATRYFKGPNPLYMAQIFIPRMNASEGPKAFNLQDSVRPSRWIVHYKGTVIAPESGTYHFVGVCDDVLVVRFNNEVVLDCGSMFPSGRTPGRFYMFEGLVGYGGDPRSSWFKGCGEGRAVEVEAGKSYPMDIIIGEWPGGDFRAYLQVRKEGVEYQKDSKGNPILPLFRLADAPVPTGDAPQVQPDGPIWRATASATTSLP